MEPRIAPLRDLECHATDRHAPADHLPGSPLIGREHPALGAHERRALVGRRIRRPGAYFFRGQCLMQFSTFRLHKDSERPQGSSIA